MAKLRRDTTESQYANGKPLRVVASGTLFLTHTLSLAAYPAQSTVARAQTVLKSRGGSASTILSLLAQFSSVEAVLVAPLGGNDEGAMILKELEKEGVITRYCKVHKDSGVPTAWVMHSADNDSRTVVNHNPLPDITHEDFVALLGPLLVPENYLYTSATSPSLPPNAPSSSSFVSPNASPRPSQSGPHPSLINPNSPAPFDWVHFEGRSVKTTLSNIMGIDGLARERKWRSHCVFSVDVGRKGRQGVEALIPHADIVFFNKHYAHAHSENYATSPRAFLLSMTSVAAPHALLVAYWGAEGAAALSLPTQEYFQSSGWKEPPLATRRRPRVEEVHRNNDDPTHSRSQTVEVHSVRSGSEFWAGARSHTPSSSAFTATQYVSDASGSATSPGQPQSPSFGYAFGHNGYSATPPPASRRDRTPGRHESREPQYGHYEEDRDDDADSQGTERPPEDDADNGVVDEVGAQDAFMAGMIYALSRRILPGPPYTPMRSSGKGADKQEIDRGPWRLDECLRFATELAGRKARRRAWAGLSEEMSGGGWSDL
ncbi:hypothetical protein HGRIS_003828 [Hohenbuehelia grisea]|uniref:Carbohydrate kinase PfkB domain-containing protein n=1 Tax=Hohenbuehelia grisea TaxID=104357 RepID=A0ABR3JID2_9AGAR